MRQNFRFCVCQSTKGTSGALVSFSVADIVRKPEKKTKKTKKKQKSHWLYSLSVSYYYEFGFRSGLLCLFNILALIINIFLFRDSSESVLDQCTKEHLLKLAEHFEIQVADKELKEGV